MINTLGSNILVRCRVLFHDADVGIDFVQVTSTRGGIDMEIGHQEGRTEYVTAGDLQVAS